jgi:hypothetical protein
MRILFASYGPEFVTANFPNLSWSGEDLTQLQGTILPHNSDALKKKLLHMSESSRRLQATIKHGRLVDPHAVFIKLKQCAFSTFGNRGDISDGLLSQWRVL